MQNAKLVKALEKEGFFLEFPEYDSVEEIIVEILKENNLRMNLALPLLFRENFNYKKVYLRLNGSQKKEFNRIIMISSKIFLREGIKSDISKIIKQNKIKAKFSNHEFNEFYDSFKESTTRREQGEQQKIEKQSKLRLNLDLNKNLAVLFSPAKIRIMQKIFNHEKLTNTELKYYYRAISKINKAVLNTSMQNYLGVIELTKKIS